MTRLKRLLGLGFFWALIGGGCPQAVPPAGDGSHVFNAEPGTPIAASGDPIFSRRPIFETLPEFEGSHAGTLAALPSGELLAAWFSYTGPHELDGSAIMMARLEPNSPTWSTPWIHINRPEGDGNPVLYAESDQLWLFQAVVPLRWSTARIEFQRSTDGGVTWTAPAILSNRVGSNVKYPPLRLADGTLLLPAYDDLLQQSLFYASSDGQNWSLRSELFTAPPAQNLQPAIVQIDNGLIIATMRNNSNWLWTAASGDQGRSWTAPQTSNFDHPSSAAQLLKLANGRLLLIFNDDLNSRKKLTVALSVDDGISWPHRKVIADGADLYSYPYAIQSANEDIHIVFSLNRDRIEHITLNEAWIVQ